MIYMCNSMFTIKIWVMEMYRAYTSYLEIAFIVNRTVGSQLVMDPLLVCKKTRRLKGKLADICRKEPSLLKEIAKGIQVGTRECQYQFRNRRWNCTTVRRSLKKILVRGKF